MKGDKRDQSSPAIPRDQPRPESVREAEEIILRGYTGPGSREMMMLWPAFVVIHEHYFPRNWITRVRRSLRLVPRLDYSRSNAGTKKFLGDAARTLRTNRQKWAELLADPAPAPLAELMKVGISTLGFQHGRGKRSPRSARRSKRCGQVTTLYAGDPCPRVRYLMKVLPHGSQGACQNLAMSSWYRAIPSRKAEPRCAAARYQLTLTPAFH